ncbi:MAG: hypothetical protein K1X72_26630 [Pyrinomonadaceae bacterium]|nr:hypothetical protein [Pyrinomonadaceae bacterium]
MNLVPFKESAKPKNKKTAPIFDISSAKKRIEEGKFSKWWQRKGSKIKNFKYFDEQGKLIADEESLNRIKSLVIPPAWKFVRISPKPKSKIQAVGIDRSGRLQYLYHQNFIEKQKQKKFAKIEKFAEYLPILRQNTNQHLALEGFPREKVLAVVVRLINSLYIRMGSEKSVKNYKTYGITTLQNRHLEISKNGKLIFSFVGKHHIKHRIVLVDEELAAILVELKSLVKAGKLFHYLDRENKPQPVKPFEVNNYLKTITSTEFSAKDFRTWGATLVAAIELAEIGIATKPKQIKKNIVSCIKKVAEKLGNTPNVCRNSYIHPKVIENYQKGLVISRFLPKKLRRIKRTQTGYTPEETALLEFFKDSEKTIPKN